MELILWRHAEAEEGFPDLARSLTAKGERQADKMADFLRPRLPHDTHILVSPANRTRQTALALTDKFHIEPSIAPGMSSGSLLSAANWPNADSAVLIVGHQPALGELASLLMTGRAEYWSIKKGAIWWFSHRVRAGNPATNLRLVMAPDFI